MHLKAILLLLDNKIGKEKEENKDVSLLAGLQDASE